MQALPTDQTGSILTAEQWADQIRQQLTASVEAILTAGQLLLDAKAALVHGEWCRMCDGLLPFSRQTAFRLMAIAGHPVLSNVTYRHHLPPAWTTLYELTKFPPDLLQQLVTDGIINNRSSLRLVNGLSKQQSDYSPAAPAKLDRSSKAKAARIERMRELAANGSSIRQIAVTIGMGQDQCSWLIRQHGIDVPAERTVKRTKRLSAIRILEHTIRDAEEVTADIKLIDLQELEPDVLRDAIRRLRKARRRIMAFVNQLEHAERKKTYAGPAAAATINISSSQTAEASIQDLPSSTGPDACATSTGDTTGIQTGTW
jgi:hypothetical protein